MELSPLGASGWDELAACNFCNSCLRTHYMEAFWECFKMCKVRLDAPGGMFWLSDTKIACGILFFSLNVLKKGIIYWQIQWTFLSIRIRFLWKLNICLDVLVQYFLLVFTPVTFFIKKNILTKYLVAHCYPLLLT